MAHDGEGGRTLFPSMLRNLHVPVVAHPFIKALSIVLASLLNKNVRYGSEYKHFYWLIAQCGTRPKKPFYLRGCRCTMELSYNGVQRKKLCFFFIEDRLRIAKHRNKRHAKYERPKCIVRDVGELL